MTEIRRTGLERCHDTDGTVVVIDVLRAFTTAAFAFDGGAEAIVLVSTVDEAFALRERHPDWLLTGEVGGLPIPGFDLPNSPTALDGLELAQRTLVLRTSSGTQGIMRARRAERLFAASLAVATASADLLRNLAPSAVTFVETGIRDGEGGEEDIACTDLIAGLIRGTAPALLEIESRVRGARWAAKFADPAQPEFPESDLAHCSKIDLFEFAMEVHRENGLLVLRPTT